MPASQTNGAFVFRAPGDPSASLTFALLRPGGSLVATNDAGVTYESGAGFGRTVETQYVIANPAAGIWTMRVTGTTVPLTGWPYDMQALVQGGITVAAKAGAGHYDVGQPFALSADVAVNATPYAGATVSAMITKPDNTTATVALTDIGGGAYTGSFGDTAACGLYQVTITAGGIDSGTPFSRQDRTLAFAGVPGNVILNPCVADSDGDGITDSDEINVFHTNPASADTDGDGVSDGPLGIAQSPPLLPGPDNCPFTPNTAQTNTDAANTALNRPGADALGDACDDNISGDGYTNAQHVALAKDPTKYCNIMRADVDGDGAVSILDLTRVAQSFIQSIPPAPERYNQDGDNKISILDLTRMAQVFIKPVTACP